MLPVSPALGGFAATLSATDVVDDGTPNRIEVESRTADQAFTDRHNVDIDVWLTFDRPVETPTGKDFEVYAFDRFDELTEDSIFLKDNEDIARINRKQWHLTLKADKVPVEATRILLALKENAVESVAVADLEAKVRGRIVSVPKNAAAVLTVYLVRKEPNYPVNLPKVVSIARYDNLGFVPVGVAGPFTVKIVLTERPRTFTSDHIHAENARVDQITLGVRFTETPSPHEGGYTDAAAVPSPSGREGYYYPYYVDITPDLHDAEDIVIEINDFIDTAVRANAYRKAYTPQREGRNRLTVRISSSARFRPKPPGFPVALPHTDGASIPAKGFYLLTKKSEHSGIDVPPVEESPIHRKPRQLSYNVRETHELPNLEAFLINGGTIDLIGPAHFPAGSVVISEILWGGDHTLADATESQWIEIYNTTGQRIPIDPETWFLRFYSANDPLPHPKTLGILDRIGTFSAANGYWSIAGKGQSGWVGPRSTQLLISMERLIYTTGAVSDGTKAESWTASTPPSSNIDLNRANAPIASPGTLRLTPVPVPVVPPDPVRLPPERVDLVISEIMYTVGKSRLPQWIELHNRSGQIVNLRGWRLRVENPPEDKTVFATDITLTLGETLVDMGEAVLLVTEQGRHSGIGEKHGDLRRDRIIVLKSLLDTPVSRYKLLSDVAFKISLIPPSATVPVDTVGNLGGWALPMIEGEARSSLLRNYRLPKSWGMQAEGWRLASESLLKYAHYSTYYGHHSDRGTPGYRAGHPLPVGLSSFCAVRETSTSRVVITWVTEAERENAGFHIFRRAPREGVFRRINPVLIPGAGTTGERRMYLFRDTAAVPNIGYAYRLVDVAFGGQSRTLATVRLKGQIAAVGKRTTTWGYLKTQN